MESLRDGDHNVPNDGLDVRNEPVDLHLKPVPQDGRIRGNIKDDGGNAVAAVVGMAPVHLTRQALYSSTTTDQHGDFRLDCRMLGSYRLFYWKNLDGPEYRSEAFMRVIVDIGSGMDVEHGEIIIAVSVEIIVEAVGHENYYSRFGNFLGSRSIIVPKQHGDN